MSLYNAIVDIKKLFEDNPIFKAASEKDVAQRKQDSGVLWYSIRVVRAPANDPEAAEEKVVMGDFEENHPVCDRIVPAKDCVIVDREFGRIFKGEE